MATIKVMQTTNGNGVFDVSGNSGIYTQDELVRMAERANMSNEDLKSRGVGGRTDPKLRAKTKTIDAFTCSCGWTAQVTASAGRRQTLDARIKLHNKICVHREEKTVTDVVYNTVGTCGRGVKRIQMNFAQE
jgi:hypothetical protein